MKRKIIAIFAIFLMLTIPFGIVEAGEGKSKKNIIVKLEAISEEGNIITEEIVTNEQDLNELQKTLDTLFENIDGIENLDELLEFLNGLLNGNSELFSKLLKLFSKTKLFKNRAFILSSGACYDLNPLKRTRFKIRKRLTLWRYSMDNPTAQTIILKPFRLNNEHINGPQIGFMNKFTGIYIHISRKLPKKGQTFFMGTAKNAFGIELSPNI